MFDPNAITTQQSAQIQYQEQKQENKADGQQQKAEFPSFCYANVNMIHKLAPNTQTLNSTVNMAQLADDKCYITQPFSYNYALVNQMQLAQNTISNITFKCDICGLMFNNLSLLNHHKRIHTTAGDQGTQHITVQVATNQQAQPQATQIQIVPADRIRFSCEECGLAFAAQSDLKAHRVVHGGGGGAAGGQQQAGGKARSCDSCGVQLAPDPSAKKKGLPVKCETCLSAESIAAGQPQIFVVAAAAPQEAQAATQTVKYEQEAQVAQGAAGPQVASLGTQNSIPIGVKAAAGNHPVKRRGMASVTKCHKCNGSGIIFIGGTKQQLSNQDKPFRCNICNGSFSRYSSLWSHKRLHSGEKNFKCNICGLAFAKAAYLKNHSRIHTGEKPYRCNVCGMQFSQSPHLKNHERIHSGERPYVCEVCEKSFARHSTLWNHRRIHTGEKPYRCDICGSCFNQATHLKNHAKVHSGEKPFKCDICSVGFSDRFALKRHRNIHEKYGRTKPNSAAGAGGAGAGAGGAAGGTSGVQQQQQQAAGADAQQQVQQQQQQVQQQQQQQQQQLAESADMATLQVQLS